MHQAHCEEVLNLEVLFLNIGQLVSRRVALQFNLMGGPGRQEKKVSAADKLVSRARSLRSTASASLTRDSAIQGSKPAEMATPWMADAGLLGMREADGAREARAAVQKREAISLGLEKKWLFSFILNP